MLLSICSLQTIKNYRDIKFECTMSVIQLNFLAYHAFGCRVIQKYLQNYSSEQKCQQMLCNLLEQSISLSQCQFGNYVMQHIVTKCKQERKKVFAAFLLNVYELSTNKYASNVMEKAIQSPDSNFCDYLSDWFAVNQKQYILFNLDQYYFRSTSSATMSFRV